MINWDVRDGVFPDGLVEEMFAGFTDLVRRLGESDGAWADPSPVALPVEQARRRSAVNDTRAPLPDGLLHDEVVARAGRHTGAGRGHRGGPHADLR